MGGSGGGGGGSGPIRYAPYVEDWHSNHVARVNYFAALKYYTSPYSAWTKADVNAGFFGLGYTVNSFPSLYDMFGKFMAGLDIEALYSQIFTSTVNSPEVNNLVKAEGIAIDDDISSNVLPKFQAGMRDMNSVMSSSYIIGKAVIEEARVKSISKFSSELKYRLIPVAENRWRAHLDWNKGVIITNAEILKMYYLAHTDMENASMEVAVKNMLWPLTLLEYERAAIGALQGTMGAKDTASSQTNRMLGGALSGAAAGAMIGASMTTPMPFVGAAVGGLIGLASSFL